MQLNQDQKTRISEWLDGGASLGEVQRRIRDEFGVHMTYMEVRLLVLDIGATVKDKEEPKKPEPAPAPLGGAEDAGGVPEPVDGDIGPDADGEPGDGMAAPAGDGPAASNVSVELDKIVRAGAAMSGTVTFSDGVTGSWVLDRYGRLGLTKVSKADYQPSAQDLQAFQIELQRRLSAGY